LVRSQPPLLDTTRLPNRTYGTSRRSGVRPDRSCQAGKLPACHELEAAAVSFRIPSYRLHKPSGLAVVTLDGRDVYLGRWNTRESRAEYNRLIAEWLANGRRLEPSGTINASRTVVEVILAFDKFAEQRYPPSGRELENFRLALRPLRELYGHTPVAEFGP